MFKPAAVFVNCPEVFEDVFSIIQRNLGNPDWAIQPEVDIYGNTPEEIFRHWIGLKVEEMYGVIYEPKGGIVQFENDILIAIEVAVGRDPLALKDIMYPSNYSVFFDVEPVTPRTVIIYESENEKALGLRAPKRRNVRNPRTVTVTCKRK